MYWEEIVLAIYFDIYTYLKVYFLLWMGEEIWKVNSDRFLSVINKQQTVKSKIYTYM